MTTQTPSEILWGQFTQAVAAQMGAGASDAAIQVLPSAQLLYGTDATKIATSIDEFVAVLPEWGAIYDPSAATLIDAYQIVLTQVQETATNGKSIQKEYESEQKTLNDMMGKASDFKVGKIKGWQDAAKTYKEAGLTPPRFGEWFKDNGLQEYDAMLSAQSQQTKKVKTLLSAEGIASPLVEALARLNSEYDKIKDAVAPAVTINPSADMLAAWQTKPTNPGGFTFNDKSTQYDYSKSVWKSETGTKLFGFISIGHRTETHSQENILSTSVDYELDMEFAAQASVEVTQGHWFDDALLRDYKGGPWVAGSQFASGKAQPFGEQGVLPLVATKLFVVMNPKITVSMNKSDFQSFYDQLNDNFKNGVNLGPFAFGGKENSDNSTICKTDLDQNKQAVTVTDTSNIPQVIAVVNQVMP